MDLNELLKKTQNKVSVEKASKIDKVAIASGSRPYDEFIADEVKKEKNKEAETTLKEQVVEKVSDSNKEKKPKVIRLTAESSKNTQPSKKSSFESKKDLKEEAINLKPTSNKSIPSKTQNSEPNFHSQEGQIPEKASDIKERRATSPNSSLPAWGITSLDDIPAMNEEMPVDPSIAFMKLAGCEKQLVEYFFEVTKKNNSLRIGPVSRSNITEALDLSINTFKRTLRKLKDKKIIRTIFSKTGNGGWTVYEFNNVFYQELLSNERVSFNLKTNKLEQQISEVLPGGAAKTRSGLPKEWEHLDFDDLLTKGFTKNHLLQIYRDQFKRGEGVLDADAMQYSLDAFRFDLENNLSILKERSHNNSPVTFFTQILAKGRPYNSFTPEKFKTPKQLEFQKYKSKIDGLHKAYEQLKEKFFEVEFQSWYENLPSDEIQHILKEQGADGSKEGIPDSIKKMLKTKSCQDFFEKYVWKDIQKNLHKKFYS